MKPPSHRRARVLRRLSTLAAALCIPAATLVATTGTAQAAPVYKAPFECGSVWGASTYSGHGNAADLNMPGTANGDAGKPVLASASGRVIIAFFDSVGGNLVRIDHGSEHSTYYGHLESMAVSTGQNVTTGQLIGRVGSTGSATGAHLHYEQRFKNAGQLPIRFDGNAIAVGSAPPGPTFTSTNCPAPPDPPKPPDADGDGVPDDSDRCRTSTGPGTLRGCPITLVEQGDSARPDFDGDGRSDYCRRVGGSNLKDSYLACTLATPTGFGRTISTGVIDWGHDFGRAWTDVNGDGRADYCRVTTVTGGRNIACTLSTGTGFGATLKTGAIDPGYDTGRAWTDVNDDGKTDYCRRVGNTNLKDSYVACTLSTGTGFGQTFSSPVIDWGDDFGRAWVDTNADGRADYCRLSLAGGNRSLLCTMSTGTGFGATSKISGIDPGYEQGRTWTDVNADNRADYCRRGGNVNLKDSTVLCTLSTGTGFGLTFQAPVLDWGYEYGRTWTDTNADGRADYCRVVGGGTNYAAVCTLSTGTGFGATTEISRIDPGYDVGRGWTDVNGDNRSDYCRRGGGTNLKDSYVLCTLSTGTGFGGTLYSPTLDWGYSDATWTGISAAHATRILTAPVVTGHAAVGQRLSASPGDWSPRARTVRYQWLANGASIAGATSATFTPGPSLLGRRISVRVSSRNRGHLGASATSSQTAAVTPGTLRNTVRPRIIGKPRVGRTLRGNVGQWSTTGLTVRAQWYRGKNPIRGATKVTRRVTRADRGRKLSVKVTVSKAGYTSARASSLRVRVR